MTTVTKKQTEGEAVPSFTAADVVTTTEEDEVAVEEEDWSNIMSVADDGGFGRHEESEEFVLSNGVCLKIVFTSSLTPLDMIDLSWGTNDATGHCIWTGARYFLQVLPELSKYFVDQNVLELGCGTGLAGIAVTLQHSIKSIVLTDSSKSVLKLCQRNCEINEVLQNDNNNNNIVTIQELSWGSSLLDLQQNQEQQSSKFNGEDDRKDQQQSPIRLFDTVFATDVLYDISSWLPLLQTVLLLIKEEGTFLLSHVPRAALPTKTTKIPNSNETTSSSQEEKWSSLEEYLIETAKEHGIDLITTFRPTTKTKTGDNNDDDDDVASDNNFNEHQFEGCCGEDSSDQKDVAIYIFQKKEVYHHIS